MRLALAVDLEEAAAPGLVDAAGAWAARTGGRLDLLNVQGAQVIRTWVQDPAAQAVVNRELDRMRAVSGALLADLLARVPAEHRGVARVIEGSPVTSLVQASAAYDALVVGTHGRRGIEHLWLGSVAEQLVRRALCPVLVLRVGGTPASQAVQGV
jgi:nucleotide-binding universal stress UspA family protein